MLEDKNLVSLLQSGFKTISVSFAAPGFQLTVGMKDDDAIVCDQRKYTYKTIDESIKVGDLVVVCNKRNNTVALAKVREVHEHVDIQANKHYEYTWIVSKVDCSTYKELNIRDQELGKQLELAKREYQRSQIISAVEQTIGGTWQWAELTNITKLKGPVNEEDESNS